MTLAAIRQPHIVLIVLALGVGLAIDARTDLPGQAAVSLVIWIMLIYFLRTVRPDERRVLMICLVIATAGEIFLSLGWGLYTYRWNNIPLFVPPGHVLLLLLGFVLAQRLPAPAANTILGCAGAYALAAAATGIDTLAVPLVLMLAAVSLIMPAHRRLYASTFIVALVLELYGTWLGNWTWAREVPMVALVTTNPPGLASAFYAVLDALVAVTALVLGRSLSARRATPYLPDARSTPA